MMTTKVHGKHGDFAIEAKGLVKRFKSGKSYIEVLKKVDFDARLRAQRGGHRREDAARGRDEPSGRRDRGNDRRLPRSSPTERQTRTCRSGPVTNYDDSNIFGKVLRGETPSIKVFEDETLLVMTAFATPEPAVRDYVRQEFDRVYERVKARFEAAGLANADALD